MKSSLRARGFTLIELLIVISIIGVLSSVVLVSVNIARTRAYDAKFFAEVKQLILALNLYRSTHNDFISLGDNITTGWDSAPITDFNGNSSGNLGTYLNDLITEKYIPKIPHYNGWVVGTTNQTNPRTWITYIKNRKTDANGASFFSCSAISNPRSVFGNATILIGYTGVARAFSGSGLLYQCTSNNVGGCSSTSQTPYDPQVGAPAGSSLVCLSLD